MKTLCQSNKKSFSTKDLWNSLKWRSSRLSRSSKRVRSWTPAAQCKTPFWRNKYGLTPYKVYILNLRINKSVISWSLNPICNYQFYIIALKSFLKKTLINLFDNAFHNFIEKMKILSLNRMSWKARWSTQNPKSSKKNAPPNPSDLPRWATLTWVSKVKSSNLKNKFTL